MNNTNIIATAPDKFRLTIKEALLISKHAPVINKQFDNFTNTLKLFKNNYRSVPTLPKYLNIGTLQPPSLCPPSPNLSQTQVSDASRSPIASQYNHITPRLVISPNINNRINSLFQNSSNQTNNSIRIPHSPPRTRSFTQRSNLTNQIMHSDTHPTV